MKDTINVGDRVNVFFERAEAELNVKVVGFPGSAGDAWRLQRMDGVLVLVQTYAKMVRTLEAPPVIAKKGSGPEAELVARALEAIHAEAESIPVNESSPKKSEESPFKK